MKNRFLFLFTVLFVSFSCERPEQIEYEYETNPQYTWGYAAYWGNYYADYGIDNNVLSLTAFTNDLTTDEQGSLVGNGQYLYLEDVFLTPEQKVFTNGTYVVSDSGEAFTIAPGSLYKEDGVEYNTGAFIYYVEENANFSTIKFIVEGSMTISKV